MINQVALLNEQKEKLTAEELTVKIGLKGVAATGFFEHTKASEDCSDWFWALVTMDDRQELGEKPVVRVFASENGAKEAMRLDIEEECLERDIEEASVVYSSDGSFAQTKDERFSWEVLSLPLEK